MPVLLLRLNQSSFSRMTARRFSCNVWLILLILVYVKAGGYNTVSRINEVLKNDTSLQYYAKCFLETGPCPADGRLMKKIIPDLVSTNCGRCSPRQKQIACKVIFKLQEEKFSDIWDDFLFKFDPKEENRGNLTLFMDTCTDEFDLIIS